MANKEKFSGITAEGEYVRYEDLPLKTVDGQQIMWSLISNVY